VAFLGEGDEHFQLVDHRESVPRPARARKPLSAAGWRLTSGR
jgi:hypothetical protein